MDTSNRSLVACAIQDKALLTLTHILDVQLIDFIETLNPLRLVGFIKTYKLLEETLPEAIQYHREHTAHKKILPAVDELMTSVEVIKVPNPSHN